MRTFLVAYLLAAVSLGVVLITGIRGRRNAHFVSIAITLVLLVAAVRFAERLGRDLSFSEAAGIVKTFHFAAVIAVFVLLFGMIVTGVRIVRAAPAAAAARRRRHGGLARGVLVAVLAATALGFAMVWLALPA